MKKITKEVCSDISIGIAVASLGAVAVHWFYQFWELTLSVWALGFGAGVYVAIGTFYTYRRNPEYQKDTREKKE